MQTNPFHWKGIFKKCAYWKQEWGLVRLVVYLRIASLLEMTSSVQLLRQTMILKENNCNNDKKWGWMLSSKSPFSLQLQAGIFPPFLHIAVLYKKSYTCTKVMGDEVHLAIIHLMHQVYHLTLFLPCCAEKWLPTDIYGYALRYKWLQLTLAAEI